MTTSDIIRTWLRNVILGYGQRRLSRLALIILLVGGLVILLEVTIVSYRYDVVRVGQFVDVLTQTEEDSGEQDFVSPSSKLHLTEREKFSHSISINLSEAINQRVLGNKEIPYTIVNPYPYTYLNRPLNCYFPNGDAKNILVFVKSPVMNIDQRIAIRSLWKTLEDRAIKWVFTLGTVRGPAWRIEQESRKYKDILQGSFEDHLNDTLKIIMSYNWAVNYCPMADIILFLNDNFYVELRKVATYLRFLLESNGRNMYIGNAVEYVPPYRDQRERLFFPFEWYMPDSVPKYIKSGAYAVSFDVAQRFQLAFPYVKYINIDDVYVGIMADKLGIVPIHNGRFDTSNRNALVWECSDVATELINKNCPLSGNDRQKLIDRKEETRFYSKYNMTSRYLYYGLNFSYPLHIDLMKVVSDVMHNKPIPHKPINPHPFKYIHRPPSCKFPADPNGNKNILIMVKSFVGNFKLRDAFRSFWKKAGDSHIKRIFLLGYREVNQSRVEAEYKMHGDMVQENFIDAYLNNTYKTIMAFNWAAKYCPMADLVLFFDDDYYVKERELAGYIRSLKRSKDLFLGKLVVHAPPYRERVEKWYLSYQQYPYNRFPPYLSGGAFVATIDVVKKFHIAFPYVKYMGLDDVYLGIVAKKLSVTPRNETYFDSANTFALAKECSNDANQLLNEQCTLIGYVIPTTKAPDIENNDLTILQNVKRLLHSTLSGLTKMLSSSPGSS